MESERVIRRADPTSIQNKVLVGYQGWFTCAGDGKPVHDHHHGWLHWFDKPLVDGGRPNFDVYPDVSEYSPEELYPVPGLSVPSTGQPAMLFSSRNPKTVQRHFNWMAMHGIDGAFLQRFATQCEVDGNPTSAAADLMRLRDEVLDRVREAAEKENRVWAIMYDVAGLPPDRIEHTLRVDWEHLMRDKRILESPYYLRERGHPVVAIWGLGFEGAGQDPRAVASIVRHIKAVTPGEAYIWGGVPSQWRTSSGDMDPNPAFLDVFKNEFDALSPWTVGRFHNKETIDQFYEERTQGDIAELKELPRRVDYFPTVLPGGSGHNMSGGRYEINGPPREGGKFFWRQLWNVKHLGVRTIYVAMFDEYDEGTNILPAVPLKRSLPKCDDPNRQFPFLAWDADGIDNLTPDWYLRICGFAAEAMRDERRIYEDLPRKELDDYWATRPKYESTQQVYASAGGSGGSAAITAIATGSGSGSGSGTTSNAAAPLTEDKRPPVRKETWGFGADVGEAPPAYTLEADETPAVSASMAPITEEPAVANPTPQPSTLLPTLVPLPCILPPNPALSTEPVGLGRSSSYSVSGAPQQFNQGAAGLGRASTFSPPSSAPNAGRPPMVAVTSASSPGGTPGRWAPPTSPPPRTGSPLRPSNTFSRPPVHPASSISSQGSNSSQGASTPPVNYTPYRRPSQQGSNPNFPPTTSPNLPQDFANMNLGPGSNGANVPPMSNVNTWNPGPGGQSPGFQGNLMQPAGSSGSSPSAYSYPTVSGYSTGTPGSNVPSPNPSTSGYFNAGTSTSYGAGLPSGAQALGIVSNPTWSAPNAPPPSMVPPGAWPGNSPGMPYPNNSSPMATPGFPQPGSSPSPFAPPSMPPPSSYQTGQPSFPGQPSYPGQPQQQQQWTSSYPGAPSGSGSNSPFPSPGLGPGQGQNVPSLPPRPTGGPGGFVAPQRDNTFLGGFVHKASGMVDRYAGESTRIQLEKGVSTFTETGTKLLGRFTTHK